MRKVDKSVFCYFSNIGFGGLHFYVTSESPYFKNYQEINYPVGMLVSTTGYRITSYNKNICLVGNNKEGVVEGGIYEKINDLLDTLSMIGLSFKVSDMPTKWRKGSVEEIKDRINKLLKEV